MAMNTISNYNAQTSVITQATAQVAIPLTAGSIGASAVGAIVIPMDQTGTLTKVFASTAVNTGNSTVTITAHGMVTGLLGQMTTSGALPTGLSLATNYYIIVIDANTVAFASSLNNANAGTKITLSAQGSGNDTFTPTALAGATATWQVSNDNLNWANWTTPASLTSGTNLSIVPPLGGIPGFKYMRTNFALTSGQLSVQVQTILKG